ncbi:E3 ubiquitin-protein ligase ubr1 [Hypsizygus marmoreus]|uniref:E3 ubiquitin-protein ligase n=1 Tax=Hypsizygus marmoreus TaxID=39966 RepID=A0A369K126_HYPMA|nr:E3 ubiquitin-protein ligase ubr1 [Hypsizygus marmoreus]
MSTFSSFLPAKFLTSSMNTRDRTPDPLQHLRFALETMPGSRKYVFTPATRAEILSELYVAFWGPYAHLFLPNSNSSLPLHATLSEVQASVKFSGAGRDEAPTPGRPCSHIFKKGESCFRCKDCALDDSCVMCAQCFHATNHVDHNVSFFIAQQPGGCCDCGDEEAWRIPLNCPFHPPSQSSELHATPKANARPLSDLPLVQDYPHRASVPPELHETMRRTVGYALDFVLDTLDYSPDESIVPANEADLRLQPSADPMMKDQYCVVLWNDDKHSFDEVIKLLCDMTNRTREEASLVAHRIDENGREVIDMNTNVTRLLETAQAITQIDLGVTIRRAYDTFREQVLDVIIEWLLDLTRSRLGSDVLILREVIAAELLSPRRRDTGSFNANAQSMISLADIPNPTRIDTLFLYHTRLWKKPRLSVKEIYASMISLSRNHKLSIAGHFANVYPRVIDAYLLVDREAETSIKYFALQLFTVPSVALHIVRNHKLVSRLLAIIAAFFTNQIVDKHIVYPPVSSAPLDVDSFPFKSKRFMPVFSDLRYLCHTASVQELIARNRDYIAQFAKTCQLFMCVNPNKRAATSHVEYETDAWISVFNVTLSLSRVIKVYGEAYSKATVAELVTAITTVVHHILMVCTLAQERLDRTKFFPISFHEVEFGGTVYETIDFDVLEGWVSFHHSLHWLLAELFKHIDLLSEKPLSEVGISSVREIMLRHYNDKAILTVIDFPLRVLAMIAQIRTGLWVRNGFAIRGQLLHYRDYMLRELCYDQDLFMLQIALIISDPSTIIVTILDRFGLLGYFTGDFLRSPYEGNQLSSMVEEVLYVFITILSESGNPSRMPIASAVRREIVHALAMGPCTYTDLVKRVAERLVEDICFEKTLKEVANFRAPESATESGLYELRDEAFEEVNPFFYHYTRNKREEVENILRARLKKKTGIADPVIVPRPFNVIAGPFSTIPSTFETEALLQVMFYALYNILVITDSAGSAPPSAEAILDQAVHLVMLALVERPVIFSHLSAAKTFEEEKTLVDILCTLEHHEKYKPYKSRIEWILTQMDAEVSDEVRSRRRFLDISEAAAPNLEEVKKRAAKARQEAIMQQMKEQQASFAINFDDADDDDEDNMEVEHEEQISYGTCIVCQEELTSGRPFGALGLVQPSRFIRRHPDSHNAYLNEVLETSPSMDRASSSSPPAFPPPRTEILESKQSMSSNFDGFPATYTRFGLHASVCSHMMHLDCFQQYSISIRQRHRAQATRNHPETISRKEYICPLCKSLGNVILPVASPAATSLNTTPFSDWIRTAGINILKSKPDPLLESLQFRNGTGEFVFWSAQDSGYANAIRNNDRSDGIENAKMLETVMIVSKSFSQQTRHLRDRPEPETGERGAGIYLPEELLGYTIASIETAQRGVESSGGLMVDNLSESQMRMVRGLLSCLTRLAALHFKSRPDEGREAVKQAIIKRLLPEWSRTSLTSFSYPLMLRDPFTILVETAAVAPEILRHVLVLTYYACLARTVIGLVYVLNKTRSCTVQLPSRKHEDAFGDVRMFFTSVVRHSPVFENTATLAFETFGEARIEKLLYAFTLPFLRRASILCRAILPAAFPTPPSNPSEPEYNRLLTMLGIPPLSTLPRQDTLQNALSGWCAHYGHSHAASQLNCGVMLDYPAIYRLARLPLVLDNLFGQRDKALTCPKCNTVPSDAAICLLCGVTCCLQSNCCTDMDANDRGECNMHTRECGGAIGIYFLVKRCSLLYLFANNGTFAQSPYLDAHGEIDISMRRGRRQYLHHARWEDARKTWLNHQIPTIVARKLESTLDSGGWETL